MLEAVHPRAHTQATTASWSGRWLGKYKLSGCHGVAKAVCCLCFAFARLTLGMMTMSVLTFVMLREQPHGPNAAKRVQRVQCVREQRASCETCKPEVSRLRGARRGWPPFGQEGLRHWNTVSCSATAACAGSRNPSLRLDSLCLS